MKVFKYKLFRYITVGFSLFTVLVFITSSCEKEKFDDTKFGSVSGQVSDADGNDVTGTIASDATLVFSDVAIPWSLRQAQ